MFGTADLQNSGPSE